MFIYNEAKYATPAEQIRAEVQAIKTIRKVYGQLQARKVEALKREELERHKVDWAICKDLRIYICPDETPKEIENFPKASNGKSKVYFPNEALVIKTDSWLSPEERSEKTISVRMKCENSGYRTVVVPKVRHIGKFVIEERLPIQHFKFKEQVALYMENPAAFTTCVQEFMDFMSTSNLIDATTGFFCDSSYDDLSPAIEPRYDNFALYIENGIGKMGLIDVEHWEPASKTCMKTAALNAITFFPLHLDTILAIVPEYEEALIQRRDSILKKYEILYKEHKVHVERKGLTPECYNKVEISEESLEKVLQNLSSLLENILQSSLPETHKVALREFVDKTLKLLENTIGEKKAPTSDIALLEARSITLGRLPRFDHFSSSMMDHNPWTALIDELCEELNISEVLEKRESLDAISKCVFETLVETGEIAYFGWISRKPEMRIFC